MASRVQEKCQPRDDAGYDEGGYVKIESVERIVGGKGEREKVVGGMVGNKVDTDAWIFTGHVERTNDRDYEIEERYAFSLVPLTWKIVGVIWH